MAVTSGPSSGRKVEVGAVVVGLAVGETHQKHGRKIDDDGDDDTDLTHIRSPFGAFFLYDKSMA